MNQTMSTLTVDVLSRLVSAPKNGISIYQAANSVQSLIYKYLTDHRSDLIALGDLFLIIPTYDYMAPLPDNFLSMAEKPRAVSAESWLIGTAWMAGTVISYDSVTKILTLNVTSSNGSGTISSWHIAVGVLPGQPIETLDTSLSSILVGIGTKTLVTVSELSLVAGQNVIASSEELPTDTIMRSLLEPEYLDTDDYDDHWWLSNYQLHYESLENASVCPRWYKVINTNIYVRPKVSGPIMISGKYRAKPSELTLPTDILPYNGLFYEVFKEGVVHIINRNTSIPDADPQFMVLFNREMDAILSSRFRPFPSKRTDRRIWM